MLDGLVRAQDAGIATGYHNLVEYKKRYPDNVSQARAEYDKDLATLVLEDRPHLVVCAGWCVFSSRYSDCSDHMLIGCRMHGAFINLYPVKSDHEFASLVSAIFNAT